MPRDSQGRPVASYGRGKLNDEIAASGKKPPITPKSREKDAFPDPDAEMQEMSPEDIHDVVSEHGPASEVHHKMVGGEHHVTSHHGSFAHRSKHGSHAEAHAHMGKAMGVSAEHEAKETPEFEAGEREGTKEGIPGLS
jgi:hypothetical protein